VRDWGRVLEQGKKEMKTTTTRAHKGKKKKKQKMDSLSGKTTRESS